MSLRNERESLENGRRERKWIVVHILPIKNMLLTCSIWGEEFHWGFYYHSSCLKQLIGVEKEKDFPVRLSVFLINLGLFWVKILVYWD